MYIKENIKALMRKPKYHTQDALAEELGVSRTTISKWTNEKLQTLPDIEQVCKMSKLMGVSVDDFLNKNYNSDEEFNRLNEADRIIQAAVEGNTQVMGLLNVDALISVLIMRLMKEAENANDDYAYQLYDMASKLGDETAVARKKSVMERIMKREVDEDPDCFWEWHEKIEETENEMEELACCDYSDCTYPYEKKRKMPKFLNRKRFENHIQSCRENYNSLKMQLNHKFLPSDGDDLKVMVRHLNNCVDGAYPEGEREKYYVTEADLLVESESKINDSDRKE